MADRAPITGEPVDTRDEIMLATFSALQKHGYAGLSIQRIADESTHSKSTFYHHFDGKEDLLLSFAEFILANVERLFQFESTGDPAEDLKVFVGLLLGRGPDGATQESQAMLAAYMELRSQAVRNPKFREAFTETSERYAERLATIIREGVESGAFADVDPDETAEFLLAMADGAVVQATTRNDAPVAELYDRITDYVDREIVATE